MTHVDLPEQMLGEAQSRWQEIVDIMAEVLGVPAGLIMRRIGEDIEVFVASDSDGNPYRRGHKDHLAESGLYCETVINRKARLLVPNALEDERWRNNPDIELGLISYLGFPILFPDGSVFGTICVLDDNENSYSPVFERLVAKYRDFIEAELELMYKNQMLGVHIREKELLLKETHHRVKNNLNTVSGLLEIEAGNHAGTTCEEVLQDAGGRVRSMTLLYDKLYQTEVTNGFPISEYLTPLIREIVELFPAGKLVTTEIRLPNLRVNGTVLQPLGIIVCELVTNSMKYAFPERNGGEIRVSGKDEGESLVLSYTDDGVGLPDSVSLENPKTFGLQIVRMLAEQLNGTVSLSGRKRNTYTIRLPLVP